MLFSDQILHFVKTLSFQCDLPAEIKVMNPFLEEHTLDMCEKFYNKYYQDNDGRVMIIGINPGRFGGGVTGIPFTDPIRLQNICGIENKWPKKQELSSVFMYEMIQTLGEVKAFYKKFYITAVSPLGFTRFNKNLNYYDDRDLQNSIKNFVIDCMNSQLTFGIDCTVAYCLGDGKNYKYLSRLNEAQKFFKKIIPLPHPRFIMQYKLKMKGEYIQHYLTHLNNTFG